MKKLFLSLATFIPLFSFAQLQVYDTLSLVQMVEALEGPGVTFDNIQVFCPGDGSINQMGQFDGTNSNIGIAEGLLLTTGSIQTAIGPNMADGAGESLGLAGDMFLDQLISPNITSDACAVEFDMKLSGDTLRFNYVFASEEYNEYVCGQVNDAFGFFISGPGIIGPYPGNAENLAIIPNSNNIPVSINTVNNGTVGFNGTFADCASLDPNWQNNNIYFTDNTGGNSVEYDGFTVRLTATKEVQRCETYHIKLVVGDGGDASFPDDVFDSGVFLENGSFTSPGITFNSPLSDLFGGCTEAGIYFQRKDTTQQDTVGLEFVIGGTAQNGIDYGVLQGGNITPFPTSLTLVPGVNDTTLNIVTIQENINPSNNQVVIYVYQRGCTDNSLLVDSLVFTLHDEIEVNIISDTLVCPGEEVKFSVEYFADTAQISTVSLSYNDQFNWADLQKDSRYQSANNVYRNDTVFAFSAIEDTYFVLSITDSFNCFGADTLFYDVLEPELTDFTYTYANPSDPTIIQFVNLSQFGEDAKYRWEFGDSSGVVSLQDDPLYVYPDTGTYVVKLSASGPGITDCPYFEEVLIKPLEIPNIITPNDDGINDYFEAFGMYDYHLQIFNRWGKKVFEDENYKNTFKGGDLSDGQYFYVVSDAELGFEFRGWMQISR